MQPAKRVFINTIAQYTRSLINTCLSLYTVRLILQALGQSDYGIYMLVGGVVALLGFITNALVITTQRHLSFYYGKNVPDLVRRYFSNSVIIHLFISVLLVFVLLAFKDWLFLHYLNIPDSRRNTAAFVYLISTGILFLTFNTSPLKALFIARENIVFISVVEIFDGILKLVFALTLLRLDVDKLLVYALMMLFIIIVQFLAYLVYALLKFPECNPRSFLSDFDTKIVKELTQFASWTTYGMGSIVLRNQGIAILFNKFFGTIINAAYGIAMQLYSAVAFVATSVLNAMNPQIMKAEGQGNRDRMFALSAQESKFISALMMILFLPLCVEMQPILDVWLDEVPSNTAFLCRCLLMTFLIDQLTYGLNTANQAIGKIRNYSLLMYTPKLIIVPIVWILLRNGFGIDMIMGLYISIELCVALMRLPYLHYVGGLHVFSFIRSVFIPLFPLCVTLLAFSFCFVYFIDWKYRFLISIPIVALVGLCLSWFMVLTTKERSLLKSMLLNITN